MTFKAMLFMRTVKHVQVPENGRKNEDDDNRFIIKAYCVFSAENQTYLTNFDNTRGQHCLARPLLYRSHAAT